MKPSELEALIQDALDEVATPAERARLEAWLTSHPDRRTRQREMEALFVALGREPLAEAPPDLPDSVLREIRARRPASRTGGNAAWTALLGRRPGFALAAPFAVGLAAGFLALGAWTGALSPGRPDEVSGTMMPPSEARIVRWELGGAQILGQTWRNGRSVWLRLEARSSVPVVSEVRYDPPAWRVLQVRNVRPAAGDWSLGAGRMTWRVESSGEILVEFQELTQAAAPPRLVLHSGGSEREEELPIAPSEAPSR